MSIYRARLRNTSNALSPRVSSEQIRLQVPPKLFGVDSCDPSDNRAVNSRQLVRLQKKHGSQRCRVELVELTVDDVWQIADAGDQELQRLARNIRRDNLELGAEDSDGLSQHYITLLHYLYLLSLNFHSILYYQIFQYIGSSNFIQIKQHHSTVLASFSCSCKRLE